MPHFGFMDESRMTPWDAELMRSRLHMRAARRRFRQGKLSAGLATLYDALLSALRWYALSPEHIGGPGVGAGGAFMDERAVYDSLVRRGTLDGGFDFDSFRSLAEDAIDNEPGSYDYTAVLMDVESVMTRLGVMPFDEDALPPEKPDAP
jgi:hypothetical protein